MSSLERFQNANKKRKLAEQKINSEFLLKSYPSIKIKNEEKELQAVVVNKQEKDYAYIYTQLDTPLQLGSVWDAKKLHLLVAEEIEVMYDVNWHKYLTFLCNVKINNIWGFFKGPEKTFISVNLKEKADIFSGQKVILVLPSNILSFGDKIMIKDRAWLVQEYDNISTEGLTYYSLVPTTMSNEVIQENLDKAVFIEKAEDLSPEIIEKPEEDPITNIYKIAPNQEITVKTEDGFFKSSNTRIKVKSFSATEVKFILPFGVDETTIESKEKGEIVSKTYRMVI